MVHLALEGGFLQHNTVQIQLVGPKCWTPDLLCYHSYVNVHKNVKIWTEGVSRSVRFWTFMFFYLCRIFNESYVPHGLKVVQAYAEHGLRGLMELERCWRQHFLTSMKPRHLPPLWSVNHNHDKYLRKYGEDLQIQLNWAPRHTNKKILCYNCWNRTVPTVCLTPWCPVLWCLSVYQRHSPWPQASPGVDFQMRKKKHNIRLDCGPSLNGL